MVSESAIVTMVLRPHATLRAALRDEAAANAARTAARDAIALLRVYSAAKKNALELHAVARLRAPGGEPHRTPERK